MRLRCRAPQTGAISADHMVDSIRLGVNGFNDAALCQKEGFGHFEFRCDVDLKLTPTIIRKSCRRVI